MMNPKTTSNLSTAEKVAEFTKIVVAEINAIPDPREGGFSAPLPTIIEHLCNWLNAKYTTEMAYRSFADRIRGPWRDSLVNHWQDHASDERSSAYDIAMRIVSLGGDPAVTCVQLPVCSTDLICFCESLIELEVRAIEAGSMTVKFAGNNGPLKVMAEQVMLLDAHHLDDLRRMCLTCCEK